MRVLGLVVAALIVGSNAAPGMAVALSAAPSYPGVVTLGASSPSPSPSPSSSVTPSPKNQKSATFGAGPASKEAVATKSGTKGKRALQLDGRPYFNYDTGPGGQIEDHIAVINFAYKPQTLNVYCVDATSATDGDFTFAPRAAKRVGAGAWLAVGTPHASGEITVPGRKRAYLPVELKVPTNASPGDHAAAVIVSLTGTVKGKSGQKVNFEQRVATRVIIRVAGPLHPGLTVTAIKTHYSGTVNPFGKGSTTVTYTVRNTGNVLLGGVQKVSVRGLFGSTVRSQALPVVPVLLPGAAYGVTAHVPGTFPELRETARVSLTPLGLQGDVNPGVHTDSSSVHFWAVPWTLIAIIIILVLLVVAAWFVRRRGKSQPAGAPSGGVKTQGASS